MVFEIIGAILGVLTFAATVALWQQGRSRPQQQDNGVELQQMGNNNGAGNAGNHAADHIPANADDANANANGPDPVIVTATGPASRDPAIVPAPGTASGPDTVPRPFSAKADPDANPPTPADASCPSNRQ